MYFKNFKVMHTHDLEIVCTLLIMTLSLPLHTFLLNQKKFHFVLVLFSVFFFLMVFHVHKYFLYYVLNLLSVVFGTCVGVPTMHCTFFF